MAIHNTRGKDGENIARLFLQNHQFSILYSNWRCSYYEIDIIASRDNVLHFIEVKTRHNLSFGFPEEAVTKKKFNNLKKAACAFLKLNPSSMLIQFDILSIIRIPEQPDEFLFIEDVYFF